MINAGVDIWLCGVQQRLDVELLILFKYGGMGDDADAFDFPWRMSCRCDMESEARDAKCIPGRAGAHGVVLAYSDSLRGEKASQRCKECLRLNAATPSKRSQAAGVEAQPCAKKLKIVIPSVKTMR